MAHPQGTEGNDPRLLFAAGESVQIPTNNKTVRVHDVMRKLVKFQKTRLTESIPL